MKNLILIVAALIITNVAFCQEKTVHPSPIVKLFPTHTRGDREFGGHGPKVTGSVSIRISPDQKHILANLHCKFEETVPNNSTAEGNWTVSIYEAPAGKMIKKINSDVQSNTAYTDNNHLVDWPLVANGNLVSRFEFNGDTGGNDIGATTNDDSYMSVYFNPISIEQYDLPNLSSAFPAAGYQIRNKGTNMLLDVSGGRQNTGNAIWQYNTNLTASQRFLIYPTRPISRNSPVFYYIKPAISNLFFTARNRDMEIAVDPSAGSASNNGIVFVQDELQVSRGGATILDRTSANNQSWKLIATSEESTYFIECVAYPGKYLKSLNNINGQALFLDDVNTSEDTEKWIIQRPRRDQSEADYGLGPFHVSLIKSLISVPGLSLGKKIDAEGLKITVYGNEVNADFNILTPQHRSVGEMRQENIPRKSYERLEGVVEEEECQVAVVDFPTNHYTHDFTFRVIPDKGYEHLLSANGSEYEAQKNIEIEWETGLGQNKADNNPAIRQNKRGDSFGFFTAGHRRNNIIWNWPTPGDSVYIEGIWNWERGHAVPHTEIHPPHFVATKRKLPASFNITGNTIQINNKPTDQFYGQRIDVFASADGSSQWNTKGLQSFAQVVNMDRQDYVFTATTQFLKPASNAILKWRVLFQSGNSIHIEPIITLLANGKTVKINYPWKTQRYPNQGVIAHTIILYWDVPASKGITPSQKPSHYTLKLNNILIKDNSDFGSRGDCIFYANVGNEWIMLNEFATSRDNILENGIGSAKSDSTYLLNVPTINTYVPSGKQFRIFTRGWENDHMNTKMGKVINENSRNRDQIKSAILDIFSLSGVWNGLIQDDDMGEAIRNFNQSSPTEDNGEIVGKDSKYKIRYSITKTN